jgi:hypothetical protein
MSGLINAQPTPDAAPDDAAPPDQSSSTLHNPLLAQTEQKIEGNIVDPNTHADFLKIVVAGLHIALANGPNSFVAKLSNSQDPISDCARGAVALVLIMRRESRGVMPLKAGIPAAMVLMLHGLDFIDRAGIVKIAEPELDNATKIFTNELFHKLGITPGMIQQATGRVHQIMQDPDAMAKINLKAGITKHPMAATPTPLPDGTPPPPEPAP